MRSVNPCISTTTSCAGAPGRVASAGSFLKAPSASGCAFSCAAESGRALPIRAPHRGRNLRDLHGRSQRWRGSRCLIRTRGRELLGASKKGCSFRSICRITSRRRLRGVRRITSSNGLRNHLRRSNRGRSFLGLARQIHRGCLLHGITRTVGLGGNLVGGNRGCRLRSLWHPVVGVGASDMRTTVALGQRLLGDEFVGEYLGLAAEPVAPAFDFAQRAIAALHLARLRHIEGLAGLKCRYKAAAKFVCGCGFDFDARLAFKECLMCTPLPILPLRLSILLPCLAGALPNCVDRLLRPHELHGVARLEHLGQLVAQIFVDRHVLRAPHGRVADQGVNFVLPIGWDVWAVDVIDGVTAPELGTNFFLPFRRGTGKWDIQYVRQTLVGQKFLRATVDLTSFRVLLSPVQEEGCDGHRRLGTDCPAHPRGTSGKSRCTSPGRTRPAGHSWSSGSIVLLNCEPCHMSSLNERLCSPGRGPASWTAFGKSLR